jgi:sulfhydrogenase subunit beta (sulfur reductase)
VRITHKADLANWLDSLTECYTVIAPQQVEGDLVYLPITSSKQIVLEFERTSLSPKTHFLPDTQVILEIETRDKNWALSEPELAREQVLFAVRPCDARSLRVLDGLLLDRPPPDTYYTERREKTVLVGLACTRLWDHCFCTSLGSAPDDDSYVDVMLYETGEEYLAKAITDRGAALLEGLNAEQVDRSAPEPAQAGDALSVLPAESWSRLFDSEYWQRLADRCLNCHACTYVCPTCRCFDVRDDIKAAGPSYMHLWRLRAWDSCMASGYRRIAGGHDPRPNKAQRLRNRYYCKFCYSPLDFGVVACVGCGRCIAACPVGIDIVEMLAAVAELEVGD